MKRSIVLLSILCTCSLFAQGEFLQRGQTGVFVKGEFLNNRAEVSYSGKAGFSALGWMDFGVELSRSEFKDKIFNIGMTSNQLSPFLTFYPFKQNEITPASFAFSVAYHLQDFQNQGPEDYKVEVENELFSFGGTIYKYYLPVESVKIQPALGFIYYGEGLNDNRLISTSATIIYSVEAALAFQNSANTIFVVTPFIHIAKDLTSYGMSMTFLLATTEK